MKRPRILVAGLGNLLLMDDGVGIHAVRAIRNSLPRGVRAVEIGTAVLDALHLIEWADTIVAFDAMQAGGAPGTVYSFGVEDVEDRGIKGSLHEVNLIAALGFLTRPHRPEISILGVEPEKIDFGLELTPPVAAALPTAVEAALKIVERALDAEGVSTPDRRGRYACRSACPGRSARSGAGRRNCTQCAAHLRP
jgi:hydrogenase maturation protease